MVQWLYAVLAFGTGEFSDNSDAAAHDVNRLS
jgi:hypothetical protein